jgi:hypothetical protein
MSDVISGSGFIPDSDNKFKQVGCSGPQPNVSFVASMTETARDALTNKAVGTMIFNTTDDILYIWNGSTWIAAT